jgi:hypothetical protein
MLPNYFLKKSLSGLSFNHVVGILSDVKEKALTFLPQEVSLKATSLRQPATGSSFILSYSMTGSMLISTIYSHAYFIRKGKDLFYYGLSSSPSFI